MANLFANSKFENFQKFPLSHGIALFRFLLFACLVLRPCRFVSLFWQFFGFERFLFRFYGFDGNFGWFSGL